MTQARSALRGRTFRAMRPPLAGAETHVVGALGACLVVLGLAAGGTAGRSATTGRHAPSVNQPPETAELEAACRTVNPFHAAAIQVNPAAGRGAADVPAIIALRRSPGAASGTEVTALATNAQVGNVYGLAYDHRRGHLYAAAHVAAGRALGPGGTGAVYRIDLNTSAVATWATLEAGSPPEPGTGSTAGAIGLGDIDIADDGGSLFVVNLFDRRIHRFALPDGASRGSIPNGAAAESWQADARPFGLGLLGSELYHGVVRARLDDPLAGALFEAWLYRSDLGGRDMTGVARTWLGYSRSAAWLPWSDDGSRRTGDEPMVADIAFREDGSPIIGLRDRQADMFPECVWDPGCAAGSSVGDLLATVRDGTSWRAVVDPPHYADGSGTLQDATWGALAKAPGIDGVASLGLPFWPVPRAPSEPSAIDVVLFDSASGRPAWSYPAVSLSGAGLAVDPSSVDVRSLSAGDLEVLCSRQDETDGALGATATAEAAARLTATASAATELTATSDAATAAARPTVHIATMTAHAPTLEARATLARATATALAPTLAAAAPSRTAAATAAVRTATAAALEITQVAPTMAAALTAVAARPTRPPATADAIGAAYAELSKRCYGNNPYFAVTCFVPGSDGAGNLYDEEWRSDKPVVVAFNDANPEDPSQHVVLAYEPDVGAVFGVAHDLEREQLYVAGYNKRLSYPGALGAGGIYQIDLRSGRTEPWAWLPAGGNAHNMSVNFDNPASRWVGRAGLGDIEISQDHDELYALNLLDRLIYRLSIPDGTVLGAFAHGAVGETWQDDARPFGLAFSDGWLYHGVIDSRATADEEDDRPLMARLYRSRPDGTDMHEVGRFDLRYARAPAWDDWPERVPNGDETVPMLVDIELRNDGDLVVGLRDRRGDTAILVAGGGDMVLTTKIGDRFIALPEPEFYQDNLRHNESSWGTLASLRWLDQVLTTVIDPWTIWSGGAAWFDNLSGVSVRRETIYAGRDVTFGKASGLGDLEALCRAPTPTPTWTITPPPSATPTASSTSTLTPPPTPTATPTAWFAYLPWSERLVEVCKPTEISTDVVVILDLSTSMSRETRGERSKREAAIEAARTFAGLLDFEPDERGKRDQMGVVGFNDTAWTEIGLSSDLEGINGALDRLPAKVAQGTRLDLALLQGQTALDTSERIDGNRPVLILLTDGLPNRVPTPEPSGTQEETVLAAAAAAKRAGTRIFTIGLGLSDDVFHSLLEDAASDPRDFYFAPDGEDLAGIYRQIAGRIIECPDDG